MRKFIVFPILLLLSLYLSSFKSFDLGNGYRLQGLYGQHGWVFNGYFLPVVTGNIMGVQGCKNKYIYGWLANKSDSSFLINTSNGNVIWHTYQEMNGFLASVDCPVQDLNREVNMVSLAKGNSFITN
ncbi:hypothetical protein [Algibacillus agarilyticus]|uniref:hypothetical protein n=1 Tax=Algibacillus agarilyticus TaxID=2234133 RepID=UPI000DCF6CB6|nr:hypothetical protein [Algibacillus agarilyticus]